MALLKCKECGKEISSELKRCIHCGAKVRKPSIFTSSLENDLPTVLGVACVLFLILSISKGCSHSTVTKTSISQEPDNIEICSAVESSITTVLKAPSTAKFPDCSEMRIVKLDSNVWQGSSYLDSENSFGAMLRTKYTSKVKRYGKDDWRVVSNSFDSQ